MTPEEQLDRLNEAARILRSIEGVGGATLILWRENFTQAQVVNVGVPGEPAAVLQLTAQAIDGLLRKPDDGPRIIVPPGLRLS